MPDSRPSTVLQFGETGQVSRALQRHAPAGNYCVKIFGRNEADFTRPQDVADIVRKAEECDIVVNAAAYTAVDKAQRDADTAMTVNGDAVAALARACAARNVPLVHISTDYVFDGQSASPYRETHPTRPINVYGLSKLAGEESIRQALVQHVIFRTSWVYSPDGVNFLKTMLRLGMERDELRVVNDQFGAPTAADDIAAAIHVILTRLAERRSPDLFGTFHYAAAGRASWFDFAAAILSRGRRFYPIKAKLSAIPTSAYPMPAARPQNSLLDCGKIETVYDIRRGPWEARVEGVISRLAQDGGRP